MKRIACHLAFALGASLGVRAAPVDVGFSQSSPTIDAWDFVEVALNIRAPDATNPFTDALVEGHFEKTPGGDQVSVSGFCDAADGTMFRVRFMPSAPGDYSYSVTYRQGTFERSHQGTFHVERGHRRGALRVDPEHRWHFIWEGTGEHYFFNGTTAFWLMGWRDERVITNAIT